MTPTDIKTQFDSIAAALGPLYQQIENLKPRLRERVDQLAARDVATDLLWAMENCTVIGLHQIGEALDDHMGYGRLGIDETYEPGRGLPPRG